MTSTLDAFEHARIEYQYYDHRAYPLATRSFHSLLEEGVLLLTMIK